MDTSWVVYLGKHTLETALLVAAPILGVCALVGVVVSLLQAVTSIRDMSLSIVPKLIGVGLTALLFGNWMLGVLLKFTGEIFGYIQAYGQ
ncbi:Flagellar biosynthetic protein FliQ [Anaerohalosphaera lusitana]|uniref:Flagellar biosynthetic protein FliQ n=1 Tax=Anaerohalosphaera lusitana TaxID=1936003 RepID=A0A1U9NGG9_9BACT|nr:flagellar biosynthetic protein FliQ [Anaerohalosphaera lusitana]AQT66905.1 Flagellar biosynthetic protein FliQ [Anaerohalosphaera lusitana]